MMSSHRRRAAIAAIAVVAGALTAPVAAVARSSAVPTLGRVNTIDASRTSYVKVRLAEPLPMFQDHGKELGPYILPGLTVSDPEKFVALALVADKGVRFADESLYLQRPTFLVWRMPTGATTTISDSTNYDQRRLPAGSYRLTVVATGPEHLTWRLPLSSAGAKVRVTTPENVPYRIQTWSGPIPAISYAVHAPTAPIAQLWTSVWLDTVQLRHVGGGATCWYNATDPSAAATENVPGVCEGIGLFGGPVDGIYLPPIPQPTSGTPRAGAMTIDATQKVNVDFLPQLGEKSTTYVGGVLNAATVFHLWLPVG